MSKIWKAMKFVGRSIRALGVITIAVWVISFGLNLVVWAVSFATRSNKSK